MGTLRKALILHGWTYSKNDVDPLEKWEPVIKILRNSGLDTGLLKIPVLTLTSDKVFTLGHYVDWLNKKILDKKVILIGHSNGGRISLAYTRKFPEKVDKLILIDSAGIFHNELQIRLKRFVFKFLAKAGRKFISSEKLKVLLYKLARERDYVNATSTQRQTMLNLINSDLTPILNQIKKDTLIIWGANDKITPLSDGIKMHKLISGSRLEVLKDARHSPQFSNPEEVGKLITDFLK